MKKLLVISRNWLNVVREWANTDKGVSIILMTLNGLLACLVGVLAYLLVGAFCSYTGADRYVVMLNVLVVVEMVQIWLMMSDNF